MSTLDQLIPQAIYPQLQSYVDLILKWNRSTNLISRNTEDDIWNRHILDCSQLIGFINDTDVVLDIGSGAGLPGLVISLIKKNKVYLIEKDTKKCSFLTQAKALTNANVEIVNSTIEKTNFKNIDIISSRALASVTKILTLTQHLTTPKTKYILLKGKTYKDELEEAKSAGWSFNLEIHKSLTNQESAVLILKEVVKNG